MVNEKMIFNLQSQLATLLVLDHAVVRRQRAQGLHFGRDKEGAMAIHRQWALPFSVDTQDPQFPVGTGHVGGAKDVHMQTIQGGATLWNAISKVIAAFCREGKISNIYLSNIFYTLFAQMETVCICTPEIKY